VERLAAERGCGLGVWPMKYLGLPLGGNPRAVSFWIPVIERVEKRLDGWKKAFLSRGGRLTLIQAVLSSLPTYYMSLFKIPVSVAKRMESMMRNFLWEGIGEGSKGHLINWDVVSRSREKGGLGIGNLVKRNISLLGKWLWRFPIERDSLWHMVIRSKYGFQPNGWDTNQPQLISSRNPWKDISAQMNMFAPCFQLTVGSGRKVRFWEDVWLQDQPFSLTFPRIYRLSRFCNSIIESLAIPNTVPVSWNFGFRRSLNDEEVGELSVLLVLLESVKLDVARVDTRRWKLETSGFFSSKSFYRFLIENNSDPVFLPANLIWKSKVPPKIKVLGWLVAHGRLNTCDLLQRRRPKACFSPHWCVLCKKKGESGDHVFVQCEVVSQLWERLFLEAGLSWEIPDGICEFLSASRLGFGRGKKAKILWGSSVLAVIWVIWMERNRRIFEDYRGVGLEELWLRVKYLAALWSSFSVEFRDYSTSLILIDWRAAVV
jgi:hypothetical protein